MTKADALALIRSDEQQALATLPARTATDLPLAYTAIWVARAIYAAIERPPTRHHGFVIRTFWDDGHIPHSHGVFVLAGRRGVRCLRDDQPGLFGERR